MSEQRLPAGVWAGYATREEHPLSSYALLIGIFSTLFAAFLGLVRFSERSLPERFDVSDIALIGVGTYRLSRLLTKASVTSIFRAPFTKFDAPTGDGEVGEKPRGSGLRHAVGELVLCPYCMGQWVAAVFTYGLVLKPRFTRFFAAMMAVSAISNFLQLAMDAAKRTVLGAPQDA